MGQSLFSTFVFVLAIAPALAQQQKPAQLMYYSDEDLARVEKQNEVNFYVDWHHQLVDRYNTILNEIHAHHETHTDGTKIQASENTVKKLRHVRDKLGAKSLLTTLNRKQLSKAEKDALPSTLDRLQGILDQAEKDWLKHEDTNLGITQFQLSNFCVRKTLESTKPVAQSKLGQLQKLAEACKSDPNYALDGLVLNYDGVREKKEKDALLLVKVPKVVMPPPTPAPTATAAPSPAAQPQAKPGGAVAATKPAASKLKTKLDPKKVESAANYVKASAEGKALPDFDAADFLISAEEADSNKVNRALTKAARENFLKFSEEELERLRLFLPTSSNETIHTVKNALVMKFLKDYASGQRNVTLALNGKGANCVAQSSLLWAAIEKAGVGPDKGEVLGLNVYEDHVQIVTYDPKTKLIWNPLSPGYKSPLRGELYQPAAILNAWLKAHAPHLAVKEETLLIAKQEKQSENFADSTDQPNQASSAGTKKWKPKKIQKDLGPASDFAFPSSESVYSEAPVPKRARMRVTQFNADLKTIDPSSMKSDQLLGLEATEEPPQTMHAGFDYYSVARKITNNAFETNGPWNGKKVDPAKYIAGWNYIASKTKGMEGFNLITIPLTKDQIEELAKITLEPSEYAKREKSKKTGQTWYLNSDLESSIGLTLHEVTNPEHLKKAIEARAIRRQLGMNLNANNWENDLALIEAFSKVKTWERLNDLVDSGKTPVISDLKIPENGRFDIYTPDLQRVLYILANTTIEDIPLHTATGIPKTQDEINQAKKLYDLRNPDIQKKAAYRMERLLEHLSPDYLAFSKKAAEFREKLINDSGRALSDKIKKLPAAEAFKVVNALDLIDELNSATQIINGKTDGVSKIVYQNWRETTTPETANSAKGKQGGNGLDIRVALLSRIHIAREDVRRNIFQFPVPGKIDFKELDRELTRYSEDELTEVLKATMKKQGLPYFYITPKFEKTWHYGKPTFEFKVSIGLLTNNYTQVAHGLPNKLIIALLRASQSFQRKDSGKTALLAYTVNMKNGDYFYTTEQLRPSNLTYDQIFEFLEYKDGKRPEPKWLVDKRNEFIKAGPDAPKKDD